jgi:hypothetical protein
MLVHIRVALGSMEDMHRNAGGWLALLWWDFWGMAWVVFLLRWFGLTRFRAQQQRKRATDPGLANPERPRVANHSLDWAR